MARPSATGRDTVEENAPASDLRQPATQPDATRLVATEIDIFQHPYVVRLENQIERLETKYEAQVRRTEELQLKAHDKLVELQRMTTIGQSKTLADFMLQAKNWIVGAAPEETLPPAGESAAR